MKSVMNYLGTFQGSIQAWLIIKKSIILSSWLYNWSISFYSSLLKPVEIQVVHMTFDVYIYLVIKGWDVMYPWLQVTCNMSSS